MRLNDVFFAGHASCITLATLAQCAVYDRGSQRVHARTRTAFAVMVPVTGAYAAAVWLAPEAFPVLWCAPPGPQGRFQARASLSGGMGRERTERTYFNVRHRAPCMASVLCAICSLSQRAVVQQRAYASGGPCGPSHLTRHSTTHSLVISSKEAPLQQHGRRLLPTPLSYPGLRHAPPSGRPARRFLYYLSYIKVAVAMAMYLPQVLLNHERRSTAGFSIEQVASGKLLCPCEGINVCVTRSMQALWLWKRRQHVSQVVASDGAS